MNEQELRNIIREYLEFMLSEQEIETSLFSPAEEKFLAKFVELKSSSLGILYAKDFKNTIKLSSTLLSSITESYLLLALSSLIFVIATMNNLLVL